VSPSSAPPPVLEVRGLHKNFGALQVTRNVSFELKAGARHALIGPNGAGKTSLVNLISGQLQPTAGTVLVNGADVTRLLEHERVKCGIARTFQINTLFMNLPVIDNLCLPIAERLGVANKRLRPASAHKGVIAEAERLLSTLKLDLDALRKPVRELPYGQQRLVEFAIALGVAPKVLLLDEPTAGVPSEESHLILDVIESLPGDIAVLIIEHNMDVVFRFAQEITVLVGGAVLAVGKPGEIAANADVRTAYLGEAAHE
jgi:branched-chain amino acid transport system ATP-binding protein